MNEQTTIVRTQRISKKQMIQMLFGIFVFIAVLFGSTNTAHAAQRITNDTVRSYMDRYNGSEWRNINVPRYFRMDGAGYEIYCTQASSTSPLGAYYPDTNTFGEYSAQTARALAVILKSGHPIRDLGLGSADYNRYATAMAVKFYMGYEDHYAYNGYKLGGFTDAQLRAYAAQGEIPGRVRMKAGYPVSILQTAIELYIYGKNTAIGAAGGLDSGVYATSASISNSAGASTASKGTLQYTATVSTQMQNYVLQSSYLPAGVSIIAGSSGANGTYLAFNIDPALAESKYEVPVTFRVSDPRLDYTKDTMFLTGFSTSDPDVQRMAWVHSGVDYYQEITTVFIPVPYDLKVMSVTPRAATYNAGDTIVVDVVVRNASQRTSPGYTLRLNGQDQGGPALAPGGTATHTYTFTAQGYTSDSAVGFSALIDPGYGLREATRINNTGYGQTTVVAMAELVPSIKTYSMKTGSKVYTNTFEPGEKVYTELITTNTGRSVARNFSNFWSVTRLDTNAGITSGHVTTVGTLGGYGAVHTAPKDFVPPTKATAYTVQIGYEVDYTKVVPERYDDPPGVWNHNTASHIVTIKGLPDLVVSELTTDKDTYEAGEKVTVKARVKNEGGSTAGSSVLRIAPTGLTAAQVTVPALNAGASSQEYTFSFTAMTALTNTQVTILATADYSKQVTEGNENNNTKSKVITVLALKPDLTFGNTHNILNTYYAGKDIVFSVQVRNLTAQPVPSVKVKLTLGDRTVTESLPVPGLGTNVAVFRIKTPESIGSYPVQLYIDPLNEIAERLPDGELNNDRNETGTLLFDGSAASVKLSTANPIRTDMPDPETEDMEAAHLWRNKAVPELPDLDGSIYHTWSEIRYVSGSYVTRNYWARLTTELSINPDPRVAIKDRPGVMESGFGIQAFVNTTIETNYDRPDKLVGTQMHWMYYPETLFYDGLDGVIYGDDLETTSIPGSLTNRASYRLSPYTVTGQHLHYTPVWFPDGNYEVLGQSFYAWSPAGQMYEQQSASVEISGDMYDRVPVLNW